MGKQIIKYGTQSLSLIFIMLGILMFINILSARFFVRADLTEKKEFTITDATKRILSQLDDIANIRFYFSKDLPPRLANLESQVRDLLDEYQAYSNGHLNVDFIDPSNDEEMKKKLQRLGIPELQLNVIEKDQQQIRKAYLGISIQFGDKSQVIPVIKSLESLEYDLTSALFKVTDSKERIIGWMGTLGEETDPGAYKSAFELLKEQYVVRELPVGKGDKIAANTDMIVVDGKAQLTDADLFAVDQFLMNGGKAIFMADAVEMSRESLSATPSSQPIRSLLESYGITIKSSLVCDRKNAPAPFNSGYVRFSLPYPFWPKIFPETFNRDRPAVSNLESLVLPWCSPLEFDPKQNEELTFTPLVNTSEGAWLVNEPFNLDPQQRFNLQKSDLHQYLLALIAEGKFKSHFTGKEVPAKQDTSGDAEAKNEDPILETQKPTSFVVIANSLFPNNQFVQMFPENMVFFINIADTLTIGDQLIGIRSRVVTERPLIYDTDDEKEIESTKSFHRFMGTFLAPIVVVAIGFIRFSLRRKRKILYANISGGR